VDLPGKVLPCRSLQPLVDGNVRRGRLRQDATCGAQNRGERAYPEPTTDDRHVHDDLHSIVTALRSVCRD